MKFGHKPSFALSYDFPIFLFIELWLNNCIGYIGQTTKNRDFRKFEKSAPSKIEFLFEISLLFNEMVFRPTSKRP